MMDDLLDQVAHLGVDAQFLGQFPLETLLEGFARLALSAGEFPQAAQVRARRALGDEQFSLSEDQAGGHFNWRIAVGHDEALLILILTLISSVQPAFKMIMDERAIHFDED
jgi:hypothetical protein